MKFSVLVWVICGSLFGSFAHSCPTESEVREALTAKIMEWLHQNNWAGKQNEIYLFEKTSFTSCEPIAYPAQITIDGRPVSTTFLPVYSLPDRDGCTQITSVKRCGPIAH